MNIIKFRPSSHSTDCTIVATCESSEAARKLCAKFKKIIKQSLRDERSDWEFPEAVVRANRALFTVHTNTEDNVKPVHDLAKQEAEQTELHEGYQELEITLKVPAGSNLKTLPLLLSSKEAELMLQLTKLCGTPKIRNGKRSTVMTFNHKGEWIYDQLRRRFLFEGEKIFHLNKRWKVNIIYDSEERWIRELLKLQRKNKR